MAGFDAWPSAPTGGGGFGGAGDAFGGGDTFGADAFGDQAFGGAGGGFGSSSGGGFASGFDPPAQERGFDGASGGGGGSSRRHNGMSSAAGALGSFEADESQRIARAFTAARSADGFVHGEEGRYQLQKTGLPDETLRKIWDMSDLDRDGRLSLREFVCAMHLAGEATQGRSLPNEIHHTHQEGLVRSVERMISSGVGLGYEGGGKSRPEDWSTADTARLRSQDAFGTTSSAFDSHGRRSEDRYFDEDRRGVRDANGRTGLGFDGPGELGRRGRDPTPRSQAHLRSSGPGDSRAPPEPEPGAGLGQLASVFEVIARLDASGELRRLSREVLEERRNLEQHLARRREYEVKLQESRGQLEALREERRRVETESSASQRHAAHLQDELGFVEREVTDAEQDLSALRESSDLSRARRGPAPYSSQEEERRDVLSKVRAEKELLQKDQRAIEDLRVKLEQVFKEKLDAQVLQQALLEKQRQTEQDRGLMLTAIEAERSRLSAMRAERIRMWEERSALEREMTDILQERWLAEHRAPPARAGRPEKDFKDGMGVPIGVPTEDYFRSAPGAMQRPEGSNNLAGLRRHTGDGNYRGDARGPRAGVVADAKGVRNEDAPSFGPSPFGGSGFG